MLLRSIFAVAPLALFAFCSNAQPIRFEAQIIDDNIAIGYGLAVGDVDGDGKPDVLLADKKQFVWYRNGDWKRFVLLDSLTLHDNVCIAARDLNGDRKVEIAVGAQWNPGETTDATQSGSVHYLVRPADPTQRWTAIELPHEPTVHRMRWVRLPNGGYSLVVAPLHGRGNKGGEGEGAKLLAYRFPADVYGSWTVDTLEKSMHLTHNFDVVEEGNSSLIYVGGKEGISSINLASGAVQKIATANNGVGEVRIGKTAKGATFIATVEPMHGTAVVVYRGNGSTALTRVVLDDNLKEGHALAVGDFYSDGRNGIVAGWRAPNKEGKVGIKLYHESGTGWKSAWIDEGGMACEDLKVADLDGDGKPDIIASGRATHNLKIYWNK